MIPLKLTLRNFMPYRDNVPLLDFTGIHTATISGDNGSGKSSIIDAITWALWDKTRAKKEDDLIHTGQNETQVEFEFAVKEQKYRVIRKRARPKKQGGAGQTQLHFYVLGDEGARSIDGDTIGQTQQKIEEILHMDYETFTNSAYLRQGHADEFTTATPADRKKVLGNILGLEVYDKLERRARDLATQRKTAKDQMQNSLGEIDAELVQLPAYEAESVTAEAELIAIGDALQISETNRNELRAKNELMETKKNQLAQLEQVINANKQQLEQLQPQIGQLQARIQEHESIMAKHDEIETGYNQLTETRNLIDVLNKNLALVNRLNQKKYDLEKIIEREQQTLVKAHALTQNRVIDHKKISGELPHLQEELKQLISQLGQIGQNDEMLRKQKQNSQELLGQIRSLEADKIRLELEITGINEKLHLLKNQPGDAKCPLCGCDLGADGIQHIENEYENDKIKKLDLIKTEFASIKFKQTELKTLSEEVSLQEKTLNLQKGKLQTRQGGLEKEITRAEEASKLLIEESTRQQEIEVQLNARNFAAPQQDALRQLEAELAKLDYNSLRHQQVQKTLENLQPFEAPKRKLDEAERLISQENENLASLEKMAQRLRETLNTDQENKIELVAATAPLQTINSQLAQKEVEYKGLYEQQLQAKQTIGNIKGRLEYLQKLTTKRKERAVQLNQCAKEEQIYRDLAEAFGKKGVQGLLIETAIPEIENEANRLLAKMTDGRMSVKFETQGATQKGDVTETLDIKISDELGIRSYEMFSGGEAFRINFSIRIALSRLLARRAGAPLPTLIIDEGFGTQDTVGIEKLKEAIVSIQDDFEKILVITHIDELRDAFPARIDITKTPDGSMISLS